MEVVPTAVDDTGDGLVVCGQYELLEHFSVHVLLLRSLGHGGLMGCCDVKENSVLIGVG